MCDKKRVFLAGCMMIVGLCSSAVQAWEWGLKARKREAIKYYGAKLEFGPGIRHLKRALLQNYASLDEPNRDKRDLERIKDSIEWEKNALEDQIVRMKRCQGLRDDFISEIRKAASVDEIIAIQKRYHKMANTADEYYNTETQKVRAMLIPSKLLWEIGLPQKSGLDKVRTLSENELEKMFKEREPKSNPIIPYDLLSPWQKFKNYFSSGPSSNFGFVQVPPQVQTRPYSFGIPQPMRDRFQMLKQQARAFPTRQMTPQEQRQEQESRFYNRRTIPNPENVFVAPY
jgi:hypothetical protein